jgi:hypothetical protein
MLETRSVAEKEASELSRDCAARDLQLDTPHLGWSAEDDLVVWR